MKLHNIIFAKINSKWQATWVDGDCIGHRDGEIKDKPKEYCTCEVHFEMPRTIFCSRCHKPLKPIKPERIEPIEQCYNDGKYIIATSVGAVINKLNEVIEYLKKKGM